MKTFIRAAAIAVAMTLAIPAGGCSQIAEMAGIDREVANPIETAAHVDTKVLAAYGLVTIALEEAAVVAENPQTPDNVVGAIARVAPAVLASANVARTAAVEYRHARTNYDRAQAAGAPDTAALLATLTQAGFRLNGAIGGLKESLGTLQRTFRRDSVAADAAAQAAAELQDLEVPQRAGPN